MRILIQLFLLLLLSIFGSCATYKPQYRNTKETAVFPNDKKILHSFYLIGDAGGSSKDSAYITLKNFQKTLKNATVNSTAIFLGNNTTEKGFPSQKKGKRKQAVHYLNAQINTLKDYKGNPIFIPGNKDWNSGLKGLQRQENFINKALGKNSFLPKNGCPIDLVSINEKLVLITIDSQWYINNWNKYPTINGDCTITNRSLFFEAFKSLLKKAQGKTVVVTMHHPLFTVGPHGGRFSLESSFRPLPIIGAFSNLIRKTAGFSNTDLNHRRYKELQRRLVTLAKQEDEIIFVSGHEHSLQYTNYEHVAQIVSGSGTKISPTKAVGKTSFSYGISGYARLDIFEDRSSFVRFYRGDTNEVVFQAEVFKGKNQKPFIEFEETFPKTYKASIYTPEETSKSDAFKKLWGERYRKDYGTKVTAATVQLDTLFGGLKAVRKGGGNQSKSLRLVNPEGKEYVMRALRKNPIQFLQATAFKNQYLNQLYQNTFAEQLLKDGFTGSHPYAPLVVGPLAEAANIFHTNPQLFYVPKQKALQSFNTDFGNELYIIEERVASNHKDVDCFGETSKIISTKDLFLKLRKNANHRVDEIQYIRSRIFDMLIGDWDRHEDQWRWKVFKKGDAIIYKPIPRDRDQAFSIMDDGWLLKAATTIEPTIRLLRSYDGDLKKPKWFNTSAYPLDMAFINRSEKIVWDEQVQLLQNNITPTVISNAFRNFPKEINQKQVETIRQKLLKRLGNLQTIVDKYYAHLSKYAVITATDKIDYIDIDRLTKGYTKVSMFSDSLKKKPFFNKIYTSKITKEIWIYGLDGKDIFTIQGVGKGCIPIRIVGGQNNDVYQLEDKKRIAIYDYASKKNTFTGVKRKYHLTDHYKTNTYNYKKLKNNINQAIPRVRFDPDDGLLLGFRDTYTRYGFERNPYSSRHTIKAGYYFATQGFDISYKGSFANFIKRWNLDFTTGFTSPNYSKNFFGFGNDSKNPNAENDDHFDLDFNRVRIEQFFTELRLVHQGKLGSYFSGGIAFENFDIQDTRGRFIGNVLRKNPSTRVNDFLNTSLKYTYKNADNKAFTTLGMSFESELGYNYNLKKELGYPYLNARLSFDHKLVHNGSLVFATAFGSQHNFNNNFEFYQAANLGANNGLRGYRNERFSGKHAYYQSSDLRYQFKQFHTGLLPMSLGIFTGFDYGRVWVDGLTNDDRWNTNWGGGLFLNTAKLFVTHISIFKGRENVRFAFRLGFNF